MPTSYVVIPAGSITESRSQAAVLRLRNASTVDSVSET